MGFFEILLIAVVALLVVGPQRMPEAVRSVALTIGRLKRSFNNAKGELEKQIGADEIRRQLHNESVMENINTIKEGLSDIDKKIANGETDMPWTEEEYEDLHKNEHDDQPKPIAYNTKAATKKTTEQNKPKKVSSKKATTKTTETDSNDAENKNHPIA